MKRLILLAASLLLLSNSAPPRPAPDWAATVTATPEGGFRQGNPDAPVKLVEYGSRTCPTCGRFAAEGVPELRAKYVATGKVSYEYRDFLVHGPPDFALALLNQCVPTPRFFAVLDAIYANQRTFATRLEQLEHTRSADIAAWQKLPPAQMATRFAEALGFIPFMKAHGVTEARARQCLSDPTLIKRIAQANADAVNNQDIDGTPTFLVNGRKMRAFDWLRLQPELWAAGA